MRRFNNACDYYVYSQSKLCKCISELYSKHPMFYLLLSYLASFQVLTKLITSFQGSLHWKAYLDAKNMLHSSSKFLSLDANILVATREQGLLYKGLVFARDVVLTVIKRLFRLLVEEPPSPCLRRGEEAWMKNLSEQ